MRNRPFEALRRRMVAGGVRVRSADRLRAELEDHLGELERELVAAGMRPVDAARHARARLGPDDVLLSEALSHAPRSFLHAHPVLAFALGPVLASAAALLIYGELAIGAFRGVSGGLGLDVLDPAFSTLAAVLFVPADVLLWPAVAAAQCWLAHRSRMMLRWPFVACLVLSLVGAILVIDYRLPLEVGGSGTLFVGFGSISLTRLLTPLVVFLASVASTSMRRETDRRLS